MESDKNVVDYSQFEINETSENKVHCESFPNFLCVLNKKFCISGFKVVLSLSEMVTSNAIWRYLEASGRSGLVVNTSDSRSRGRGFEPHSGRHVVSLSKTYLPPKKVLVIRWLFPNMTEKLFTGTLSTKPKKLRRIILQQLDECKTEI